MIKKRSSRSKKSTKTKKASRKVDKNMRGGARFEPQSSYADSAAMLLEFDHQAKVLRAKAEQDKKPLSDKAKETIANIMKTMQQLLGK